MSTKQWLERLRGRKQRGVIVLDRTEVPEGKCELCGKDDQELRPYGPREEWICYDCGMKDEAATARAMNRVIFGEETN